MQAAELIEIQELVVICIRARAIAWAKKLDVVL
jgi:hypothetical protein